MIEPTVRKVAPVCVRCGGADDLIEGDGPVVCRPCIVMGGRLGSATVRRNDTKQRDHENREGQWP